MNGLIPNQIKVKDMKFTSGNLVVSVEPDTNFALSLVTDMGVDRKTVQQVISTVNKYNPQQISKKTQDEILSGKISEQSKAEVISVFNSMSPDRQKQVLQEITRQIDPAVLINTFLFLHE